MKNNRKSIPEEIRDYVVYDETSPTCLRWIKYDTKNQKYIGDIAGSKTVHGYYAIGFKQKPYLVHRVVYFLQFGYCPDVIDHKDSNRKNNLISNLRPATISENNYNQKISKRNTSGVKGITSWMHPQRPGTFYWRCRVTVNKKEVVRHFQKSEYTLEYCAEYIKTMRQKLHEEFANNG